MVKYIGHFCHQKPFLLLAASVGKEKQPYTPLGIHDHQDTCFPQLTSMGREKYSNMSHVPSATFGDAYFP